MEKQRTELDRTVLIPIRHRSELVVIGGELFDQN